MRSWGHVIQLTTVESVVLTLPDFIGFLHFCHTPISYSKSDSSGVLSVSREACLNLHHLGHVDIFLPQVWRPRPVVFSDVGGWPGTPHSHCFSCLHLLMVSLFQLSHL